MKQTGWDRETSPFHSGEQELQDRVGLKEQQELLARQLLRPSIPEQHRQFFADLPFVIAGSVDTEGWPWASMLSGMPGFMSTPTEKRIQLIGGRIDTDPFWSNAKPGQPVGFLGIELHSRRRNRVNGVINDIDNGIHVDVVQSFGNCPQYIHSRELEQLHDPQALQSPELTRFTQLDDTIIAQITNADTFFVASYNPSDDVNDTGGVDVSHRGGRPGFVKVDGNTLTIPDYIGNFLFQTFGNFLKYPKAGLLFIDFSTGDIIQLTGTVDLLWDGSPELDGFRGAERGWQFHLDHGHVLKGASAYRWRLNELSLNAILTGDWAEAQEILSAENERNSWRPFIVKKIVEESSVIRSFYLEPDDGAALPPFKPGQFLTIRVAPQDKAITRTYTVSSAPSDPYYRISVKREGLVSHYLHDQIEAGARVDIRAPIGAFWMDTNEHRPAVLMAAGVGITPMMSMIRQATTDAFARRHHRQITLIHAAQTIEQRAFADELIPLQDQSAGALRYVSVVEKPSNNETLGLHYHAEGRITPELLQYLLPIDDYDFYLCGPAPFMQGMYDSLIKLGIQDTRIFAEAFGPASLKRHSLAEPSTEAEPMLNIATEAIVQFEHSKFEQAWTADQGSLLEFSEAHGLTPEFGCRGGSCGSCVTKLKQGKVAYTTKPAFPTSEDEVLICCAVPAQSDQPIILDL